VKLTRIILAVFAIAVVAVAGIFVLQLRPSAKAAVPTPGTYGVLTPEQLNGMLQHKDFTFINVHIPYEGEIDKTDEFIPYNKIDDNLSKLPAQKNAKIVVYCLTGYTSAIAAKDLVSRGYTNVYLLDGGMNAWRAAGYTILNRPQ
jgi:rhodanese-related sulfurtransferase